MLTREEGRNHWEAQLAHRSRRGRPSPRRPSPWLQPGQGREQGGVGIRSAASPPQPRPHAPRSPPFLPAAAWAAVPSPNCRCAGCRSFFHAHCCTLFKKRKKWRHAPKRTVSFCIPVAVFSPSTACRSTYPSWLQGGWEGGSGCQSGAGHAASAAARRAVSGGGQGAAGLVAALGAGAPWAQGHPGPAGGPGRQAGGKQGQAAREPLRRTQPALPLQTLGRTRTWWLDPTRRSLWQMKRNGADEALGWP